MFTIGTSDTIKFVTNDFLPVKTLGAQTEVDGTGSGGALGSSVTDDGSAQWDVENSATDGGIFHVVVTNGGSGYTDGTYTGVSIAGDGSGATCSVVVSSGAVSYVTVSLETKELVIEEHLLTLITLQVLVQVQTEQSNQLSHLRLVMVQTPFKNLVVTM